jgi:hypothetical protein
MKIYISYVLQDEKEHRHLSEVVDFQCHPATPHITVVMKWIEKRQTELSNGQEIILLNIFGI